MAKQVTKGEPLTKEEQAKLNKLYNARQAKEDKLKPGELAEILDEDLAAFRKGDTSVPVSFMGKKEKTEQPKKVVPATPVVKKEEPKVEVKKEQPVEKKVVVKAVVEQKPAEKVKVQDTRGYNKKGKQTVASKIAQKTINQQTFRRGLETAANNLLRKAESSLRFKKALKDQVIKKK